MEMITYAINRNWECGGSLLEGYPFWIWNQGRVYNFDPAAGEYPEYDGFPDDSIYWRRVADEGKKLISLRIQNLSSDYLQVDFGDELYPLLEKPKGIAISPHGAKFIELELNKVGNVNLIGCYSSWEATEDVRVIALIE